MTGFSFFKTTTIYRVSLPKHTENCLDHSWLLKTYANLLLRSF